MANTGGVVANAARAGLVILAFNVPCLPMVEPVIRALVDQDAFALIEVARLDWTRFDAQGPVEVMEEFLKWYQPAYVRLHLDHVPVTEP